MVSFLSFDTSYNSTTVPSLLVNNFQFKDEEAHFVKGQHEPLVSESLFYQVQDVRPTCEKILTGSKSKGRTQDYFYYHCVRPCRCRFRAENANDLFVRELKTFIPRPELVEVYQITLSEAWYDQTKHAQNDKRQFSNQISELEGRISYLRELLTTQKIDPEDCRTMKADYSEKIDKLLAKLSGFSQNQVDINGLLNTGIKSLLNLENLYKDGDIVKKREIIGSIYPEKLTFDGFSYRTARLNEAVRLIYSLGAGFSGQKNRTSSKKIDLSCLVTPSGFKPETF